MKLSLVFLGCLVFLLGTCFSSGLNPNNWRFWRWLMRRRRGGDDKVEKASRQDDKRRAQNESTTSPLRIKSFNKGRAVSDVGSGGFAPITPKNNTPPPPSDSNLISAIKNADYEAVMKALGTEKPSITTFRETLTVLAKNCDQANGDGMLAILNYALISKLDKKDDDYSQVLVDVVTEWLVNLYFTRVILASKAAIGKLAGQSTSPLLLYLDSEAYEILPNDFFDDMVRHPNIDVNMIDEDGETALSKLVKHCRLRDLKVLLKTRRKDLIIPEDQRTIEYWLNNVDDKIKECEGKNVIFSDDDDDDDDDDRDEEQHSS